MFVPLKVNCLNSNNSSELGKTSNDNFFSFQITGVKIYHPEVRQKKVKRLQRDRQLTTKFCKLHRHVVFDLLLNIGAFCAKCKSVLAF